MSKYAEAPDIEEMDDLLSRAICAAEFGECPAKVVLHLASACYAYTSPEDKAEHADLWVAGPKILDHLRQSLKQRGVERDLGNWCRLANWTHEDIRVYAHTLDMAADGIAQRLGRRRRS